MKGEREEKRVWKRNTDSPGSEQKPTLVFIMVEAGANTEQIRGAMKSFGLSLCECVCARTLWVHRRLLWLTGQTLCGLTRRAARAPELENTFSPRRLPRSQPAAPLLSEDAIFSLGILYVGLNPCRSFLD